MSRMPSVALAAVPGRRKWTVEMAQQLEKAGFEGIYCASFGDGIGLCLSIAHSTKTIRFGTAIANIYTRHSFEMAQSAAYIHEISDGRFVLGLGVSHGPTHARLGVQEQVGKPLSDMRQYVEGIRAAGQQVGELPPVVLATLRKKMVALSVEIGDGAVWANASRSYLPTSLSFIPEEKKQGGFFIGNMIPICIDDDKGAAAAVCRRTLTGYVMLPNYRNYWKEAGYREEMEAIEKALAEGNRDALPGLMSDRWLADSTMFGPAKEVREGVEAWYAAGCDVPMVVPSSTKGGQVKAFEELLEAFS